MLATIFPYFLLANASDKSIWSNGPEFKFDSNVEIRIKGLNGTTQENGFNITNEFTCRPKTNTALQCQFQHTKLIILDVNTETGQTIAQEEPNTDCRIFPSFFFGIGFDKNGVNKIIINETLSEFEEVLDIAKAMASALNVATDLSGAKQRNNRVALRQVHNIVSGKCKGDVMENLQPSSEENSSTDTDLEKFARRNLNLMKTWSLTDCTTINKFFWLGTFVKISNENRGHEDDLIINLDQMNVAVMNMRIPIKKNLDIQEISDIRLIRVQPAVGVWPEIENTVTIDLNEQI